ncbi:MAG: F0F1 ATP synthase subunit B [Kribbellaceae bacterium]
MKRISQAAEQGGHELNPLLPASWFEVGMSLAVFGIVVYFVAKKAVPAFERAYAERTAAIEGGIKQAEEAQAKANAALESYQSQLSEAKHEAARIREDARQQGAEIVAEMREQARAEANRISSTAHAQIEAERQQAVQQLRVELGTLATTLAGRIVGEALEDDARQARMVERFIAELEEQPTAGPVR